MEGIYLASLYFVPKTCWVDYTLGRLDPPVRVDANLVQLRWTGKSLYRFGLCNDRIGVGKDGKD